jgi:hypothetical protein
MKLVLPNCFLGGWGCQASFSRLDSLAIVPQVELYRNIRSRPSWLCFQLE